MAIQPKTDPYLERLRAIQAETAGIEARLDALESGRVLDAQGVDEIVQMHVAAKPAKYEDFLSEAEIKEIASRYNQALNKGVDCDALDRVLGEEHLRGAVLDVTNPEPLPIKHPLWRNPRCVLTPHISGGAFGHSDGTEERICQVVCDNLRRYVAGEELAHRVI